MSAGDSTYTVGRGKPPLHTRFQKGQSGNPSGKPGPARLARQRFRRALCAALGAETAALKDARPRVTLDAMVRRLMLDAAGGNTGAMKLILSELEREIARSDAGQADNVAAAEPACADAVASARQGPACADVATPARREDQPPPVPDYARWRRAHPDE